MPSEVIEFDMVAINSDDHHLHGSPSPPPQSPPSLLLPPPPEAEAGPTLEPREGMEFESEEAAKTFYNSYARRVGFSTRVSSSRRSRRDGAIIQRHFVCAREGFRVDRPRRPGQKRARVETRVGCKACMVVKARPSGSSWVVSSFARDHNHDLVPPDQVHSLRSHRHVGGAAKSLIDTLQSAGIGPSGIMAALVKEFGSLSNAGFTQRDCRNYMSSDRERSLGGDPRILVDYLTRKRSEDPEFFFSVQGDEEDQITSNVFWADPRARTNYTHFGDTVTFDTSYRASRYRLPLASFAGVNHHGQPVLFGCALMVNESESSFLWLFETFLASMSGKIPVSITTDHDRAIRLAVNQVFPGTHHRFCKWHIFKEVQEKLSHVLAEHPGFETELHRCVNLSESPNEFESSWSGLVEKFGIVENGWVRSLFETRSQWVPVYVRDVFFAESSVTQRSDSINSYFDGYVNAATTLQLFAKQYEKALENRYEKEIKADYDTINVTPVLMTPSPMEKQAAEIYTKRSFSKFQEELVGTLTFAAAKVNENDDNNDSTYRVSKYGESQRAYFVKFNSREMKASCSCQMYEFSGILCRHVLAVFRVTNVLTLPSRYVLKRWTRHAKSGLEIEDRDPGFLNGSRESPAESFTGRYNSLRREAVKYVDEGVEVYDVAMEALREAAMKVELAKSGARLIIAEGPGGESSITFDHYRPRSKPMSTDDQDEKIEELMEELERARQKQEAYRVYLNSVLKDIEDKKMRLSLKAQKVELQLKE